MKYCSQIEHTITFHQRYIGVCNVNGYDAAPVYYELYKTRIEDMNFGKKRLSFQEMINTEKIKKFKCSHCCYIEEKDDDEKIINKYNLIILKHWTACNCNCIYCYQRKDIENGKPIYNPAPIIEDLYKQDLIDKENLVVNFHGGDIGVLENFDELVNLFKKNGYQRIDFATNNIIYQPTIEEIIREQKCTLCLSLDCGSRKTYKKIKGVDKFDTYIKNLSKYVQATENKRSINVHYILVKGINDNKREIKKFLKINA